MQCLPCVKTAIWDSPGVKLQSVHAMAEKSVDGIIDRLCELFLKSEHTRTFLSTPGCITVLMSNAPTDRFHQPARLRQPSRAIQDQTVCGSDRSRSCTFDFTEPGLTCGRAGMSSDTAGFQRFEDVSTLCLPETFRNFNTGKELTSGT